MGWRQFKRSVSAEEGRARERGGGDKHRKTITTAIYAYVTAAKTRQASDIFPAWEVLTLEFYLREIPNVLVFNLTGMGKPKPRVWDRPTQTARVQ